MPHVLALHRSQVHVLPQVVIRGADAERLQLLLPLQVILGDTSLDHEGADFDLLVDLLLALEFDLLDDLLDLVWLCRLLLQVVRPCREYLEFPRLGVGGL
jgi:hypothetical protein